MWCHVAPGPPWRHNRGSLPATSPSPTTRYHVRYPANGMKPSLTGSVVAIAPSDPRPLARTLAHSLPGRGLRVCATEARGPSGGATLACPPDPIPIGTFRALRSESCTLWVRDHPQWCPQRRGRFTWHKFSTRTQARSMAVPFGAAESIHRRIGRQPEWRRFARPGSTSSARTPQRGGSESPPPSPDQSLRSSRDRRASRTTTRAQFLPGTPMTPPPGCVPDPHRYSPWIGDW